MPAPAAITVRYMGGDRLVAAVRGHELATDQPVADGGDDSAPTPTELFVASLASCVAFYAERFLRRHRLPAEGLSVSCGYEWAENPHRVGLLELSVHAPGLPEERRAAFERVVEHCTVHSSLLHAPEVRIRIAATSTAAA